jgi:hypothetical protein
VICFDGEIQYEVTMYVDGKQIPLPATKTKPHIDIPEGAKSE